MKFCGWFQCRLATDPDPSDEPRGVSGYMKALPGEPDLDRIIKLQRPIFRRSHTQEVGVFVREVYHNGKRNRQHLLLGASVSLLNNPVFKGENGVIAEDGKEPIVPFILQIKKNNLALTRSCPEDPSYTEFPYEGLQSSGIVFAPGQIAEATDIFDIRRHLDRRIANLRRDQQNETDPTILENIKRRIELLRSGVSTRFFGAIMSYFVPLASKALVEDPDKVLTREIDAEKPWIIDFWMGGWDPDAACGFMQGYISIPEK
jgi:hypothetical protein